MHFGEKIKLNLSKRYSLSLSVSLYSLLPSGEQQTVVEEVEVHRLGGQLQLGAGDAHGLGVHLQQLPVLHQPAGLGDEWEDLAGGAQHATVRRVEAPLINACLHRR